MPNGGDATEFYKNAVTEWLQRTPPTLEQEAELAFLEFDLKRRVDAAYVEEMSMIPNFFLLAIMGASQDRKKTHYDYLRFLEEKREFIRALGIDLFIPGTENNGSALSGSDYIVNVRYEIVKASLTYLSQDQQKVLNALHQFHLEQKKSDKQQSQDQKEEELRKNKDRQEEAERRKREKE